MSDLNMTKQDIINRIGYFRNKKRISAYKLGIELGHSKTYFYRIESGEIQLTIDMLLDVLDILGVSTSEFFCPFITDEDKTIFDSVKNLSEDNKKTITELLNKLN